SAALRPVPVPFDAGLGEDRGHLRRLAADTDVTAEPVLGLLTRARALQEAGDGAPAGGVQRPAGQAQPHGAVLRRALGDALARQQRWAEAAACYAAARALHPELGLALAEALLKSGRAEEGLALFERLLRDRPDDPWLYLWHGYVLHESAGRYK